MAAATGKRSGVLKNLIMMFGVDAQDECGRTPLMFAALGNKVRCSVPQYACSVATLPCPQRTCCSTILECSAEVDNQDHSGLTALHVACYHGSKDALGVLLAKHASLTIFDRMVGISILRAYLLLSIHIQSFITIYNYMQGHSCLHWASVPASPNCMEQLLK